MSARVFGTHEATLTIQRVIGDKGLFELDPQQARHYTSRGVQLFETWLGYFLARAAAGYMQQVRGEAARSVPRG